MVFFSRFQLRYKGRDRCRHHSAWSHVMPTSVQCVIKEGAPLVASLHSQSGDQCRDGGHQHPTSNTYGSSDDPLPERRLDNLTIGLCGDLKFGRTVHSLISALVRYTGIRFVPDFSGRAAYPKLYPRRCTA